MLLRATPLEEWRRWFAWRPVLVDCRDGTDAWAWLRWVEWSTDAGSVCLTIDYRLPMRALETTTGESLSDSNQKT